MLTKTDNQWTQGEYVNFKDDGKPNARDAKTRIFLVTSRSNNSFLGYIRWFGAWRKYCYFTADCILDSHCLKDITEFCETKTAEQQADWKPRPHAKPFKATLVPRS